MKDWFIIILFLLCQLLIIANQRKKKKLQGIQKENTAFTTQIEELEKELLEERDASKGIKEHFEELKKSEEKCRRLATTDHVTGLPNRMAFMEMLDSVLKTIRKEEKIAVMHIDVDEFRKISETIGRSYGDELLIDVTDRIRQVMDDNDFFACMGGDEFLVLSQNIEDIGEYEEKVKKIRHVFSYPFVLAAKEVFVTVSIGIAFAPKDGKTVQTILKNLDSALYQAKSKGKNSYCYYEEDISKDLMGKIELQAQLRSGIENGEFVIYYEPQINLHSGKIEGFEALLRWKHPARGILLPSEFVETAENAGLMVPIGKWMLPEICTQLKNWQNEELGKLKISINLSARQFADPGLFPYITELLEEKRLLPNQLVMEITEAVALEDLQKTTNTILKLKELGIAFSLDKFGTGYSSMSDLKSLPVDYVKIDKQFLDAMEDGKNNQKLLGAIISLIRAFGFSVIAIGVEHAEQEAFLKKTDCELVQGFLYSEPITAEAATKLLQSLKSSGSFLF